MMHRIVGTVEFYRLLLAVDRDLAEASRQGGCLCGGPLHQANYPRSPRGGPPGLPEGYEKRLSFCCGREGCRKRSTPPSVRLFGRRWYLAPITVLISALEHGATPRRLRAVEQWLDRPIGRRTLDRWRCWWREAFPASAYWRALRGHFSTPVAESRLPLSLIERFEAPSAQERLVSALRFLGPWTTALGARYLMGFSGR
jgi:hypothetical protein